VRVVSLPLVVIALVVSYSFVPQTGSSRFNQQNEPSLRASIQLISQSYCGGCEKPIGYAIFQLHIKIQNQGSRPVILCKKYVGIYQPLLANVLPEGTPGNEVFNLISDGYGFDTHYPTNLKREYEVVSPERTFDLDRGTEVYFHIPSVSARAGGTVDPGDYFLRIEIATWGGPPDAVAVLQSRWRATGDLFAVDITSNFIPVKIDPPKALSDRSL
jgi:hypothetical protein